MRTRIMTILVALLLISTGAFAQSGETPMKGDVNEDGKVDVADINAIIKIMKDGGGTAEAPTYYWYVGQTDPSTMSSIDPIIPNTDKSSPGWREIGTTLPTGTTTLFDESNTINFGSQVIHYIAVPKNTLNISSGGIDQTAFYSYITTKQINNVTYYIYKSKDTLRRYAYTTKI